MKILTKVAFGCPECQNSDLVSIGAVRTEDNKIYFIYQCSGCEGVININSDNVAIQLFTPSKAN